MGTKRSFGDSRKEMLDDLSPPQRDIAGLAQHMLHELDIEEQRGLTALFDPTLPEMIGGIEVRAPRQDIKMSEYKLI